MAVFETILVMLAAAVLLLVVARRYRLPYPVLVALAGAVVALAPVNVSFQMDPELVLPLFVAPVLLDAAFDTSLRDLKRNWIPVTSLVLVAVGLTTAAVAWVVHAMVPAMPWAAAIAIGAIVAPPDAAATTTVLREVKLPHRIAVILEGEALLNDASALLIYRLAVTAVAAGGSIGAASIAPLFLVSLVGSVIAGPALAWFVGRVIARITDAPSSIIMQFVSTFGVWVLAERLGLSPILTIVTYAMTLSRSQSAYSPARLRVPSYAVWETGVLVLNVLAFLMIGLQLGPVLAASRQEDFNRYLIVAAAVLATVIVVRLLWTLGAALWAQWRIREGGMTVPGGGPGPNWQTGLVVGWAGTRGIVTVATALALPEGFPERQMLLFAAFTVTLGTLLLQGLTLRSLVVALNLPPDKTVDREVAEARRALADAALTALDGTQVEDAEAIRAELQDERLALAGTKDGSLPLGPKWRLRQRLLAARRDRLQQMRREGAIGDDAFHQIEEELDLAELAISSRE